MNGSGKTVINEIRALLSDKDSTPLPATRDRLILAALADVYESMEGFGNWRKEVDSKLSSVSALNKVVIFVGSALGLSLIGLLFMLMTGQATLILR